MKYSVKVYTKGCYEQTIKADNLFSANSRVIVEALSKFRNEGFTELDGHTKHLCYSSDTWQDKEKKEKDIFVKAQVSGNYETVVEADNISSADEEAVSIVLSKLDKEGFKEIDGYVYDIWEMRD